MNLLEVLTRFSMLISVSDRDDKLTDLVYDHSLGSRKNVLLSHLRFEPLF